MSVLPLALAYAVPCCVAVTLWMRLDLVQKRMRLMEDAMRERRTTVVEIDPLPAKGPDFDADARFDLMVNGSRAGYAMTPDEVKTEIAEGLDIGMRQLSGFPPPTR